jgi:hypothetical protein
VEASPDPSPAPPSTLSTVAGNYGGGIRYFEGEKWGFRFGAEGYYTKDPFYQTFVGANIQTVKRHGFGQVEVGIFKQFK